MDKLTEQEIERYREHFNLFDKHGQGKIDIKELGISVRSLGFTPEEKELNDIMEQFDANGSGTIEFEEFVELCEKQMKDPLTEAEIETAFKVFDKKGDGHVTASEFKALLTSMGEKLTDEEASEFIFDADRNDNGTLELEELAALLFKQRG